MTVSERQRLDLYERLGETLGRENAEVLMEYLPPVGWGDVARRHDIDAVRAEVQAVDLALRHQGDALRSALEAGLAGIRQELHEQVSRILMWVVGAIIGCVGVVVAVVSSLS